MKTERSFRSLQLSPEERQDLEKFCQELHKSLEDSMLEFIETLPSGDRIVLSLILLKGLTNKDNFILPTFIEIAKLFYWHKDFPREIYAETIQESLRIFAAEKLAEAIPAEPEPPTQGAAKGAAL